MDNRIYQLETRILLDYLIFRVEEARFRQELSNGELSDEIIRLNLERGDSAAAIIHNPDSDTLVMVEQFRYPTYKKGPGWTLELPAGIINTKAGETPEKSLRRELLEEIGYDVQEPKLIQSFYASPGGSSEQIYLYYALIGETNRVSQGGGTPSTGEFIRLIEIPVEEALRKAENLEIIDAKTIIGLQWLKILRLTQNVTA